MLRALLFSSVSCQQKQSGLWKILEQLHAFPFCSFEHAIFLIRNYEGRSRIKPTRLQRPVKFVAFKSQQIRNASTSCWLKQESRRACTPPTAINLLKIIFEAQLQKLVFAKWFKNKKSSTQRDVSTAWALCLVLIDKSPVRNFRRGVRGVESSDRSSEKSSTK